MISKIIVLSNIRGKIKAKYNTSKTIWITNIVILFNLVWKL